MSAELILARLRRFLFATAGFICAGTVVELALAKHWQEPLQLIPFVLCGLGVIIVVLALLRPGRAVFAALRGCMVLIALGSALGIYQHIAGNITFQLEIKPGATFGDIWLKALTGANPLLAPGVLVLAAVLAIAATYPLDNTPTQMRR